MVAKHEGQKMLGMDCGHLRSCLSVSLYIECVCAVIFLFLQYKKLYYCLKSCQISTIVTSCGFHFIHSVMSFFSLFGSRNVTYLRYLVLFFSSTVPGPPSNDTTARR